MIPMDTSAYLTQEGFDKLKAEHEFLIQVRRKELATRIQEAKELGDLSENAEYQEAKTEQGFNEGRIEELDNTLKHAVIIKNGQAGDAVQVGSSVEATSAGKTLTFHIVGSNEADPFAGKISNESPLGKALLGKRVGESVAVPTPKGPSVYAIASIK